MAALLLGSTFHVESTQACTCSDVFVATSVGFANTHDVGAPVVFIADDWGGDPLLLVDGEQVEVRKTQIVDDALCGGDLVAYAPIVPVGVGAKLSLVDPYREEWVTQISEDRWAELKDNPYFDQEDYRYEYAMVVVEPREIYETDLSVRVSWESWWPQEFSGGGCAANELIPYESRGRAHVEVTQAFGSETRPPEFYVSARVLLPGGDAYQEVGSSYVDDEGRSRGGAAVPLTHADEVPECVFVIVYDHFLEPVFEKDICAEPHSRDSRADANAYETFTARLRELSGDLAMTESELSAGCAYVIHGKGRVPFGGSSMFGFWLALCVGLIVARRTSCRCAPRAQRRSERQP